MAIRFVISILIAAWAASASAANGDLDPSFGTGGFRLAGILDAFANIAAGTAVQTDGKIVICESEYTVNPHTDFFVARFTADGDIDDSFSFDGHNTVDFDGADDVCTGLAIQGDGKIVLAGSATPASGNSDFAVARLNSDGSLDTSFGAGTGKVVVGFDLGASNADLANAVALRPDGRIVVAGSAQTGSNGTDFALLQLNTDGSRDTGFNLTGRVTVGFDFAASTGKNDMANQVALDEDGRIVAAGTANRGPPANDDMAVVRVLPGGQLDTDFSADGRATLGFDLGGANGSNNEQAIGMAIGQGGRILLTGITDTSASSATDPDTSNYDVAVARLLPDGSPDATFGIGGKATVAFDLVPNGEDEGFSILEQGNGKLMIAGTSFGPAATSLLATVARLNADGTPDAGFAAAGKRTYDFGQSVPSGQLFNGIVMQGQQVVLAGALNSVDLTHIDLMVARIIDDLIFADGFNRRVAR
jgi:uncharacterized delta-60 repeat protein